MRLLLKIRKFRASIACQTEEDLHQFDQTIIVLKPANEYTLLFGSSVGRRSAN
jgi:hypothetical protein